ncbi:hypothetical protein M438DRAFT_367011 [Aureobasidium pullulans EXF-150]|uniref:Peptidase S8/S53 domain-containing protein n=1 Tax=Aureobasidium pullulans EXF-150 TaxID=1043002 RepID=A0A074XKF9_AURPU|nr:uncharacterized protein M438DRAFT_367011 [Aureobasidium pullulans EXF-150]KEQ82512.1 hypothetical protein M438DRAFT_367011 [Aureobasidium pullulans EXF-150]
MQPWTNFLIVVVTIFAAFASASSATAISSDNATYVAPLIETCPVGSSTCGKIKDKYLVMLREGYEPASHLSYISRTLHVDDPVKEWRMMWHGDGAYSVHKVSADSIDILRRDPGVEEIEEGYWFQMDLYKIRSNPKVEAIDEHEPWEMIKQLVPSERQNSTIQQRDSQPWFPAEWPKAPWHLQALSAGQKLDNIRDSGPATQVNGVDVEHRLFQGRARNFHKCYVDTDGECFKDKVGHGTAVAGCAGARFYGTAQGANIINVKTFFSFNKYMFLM